MRLQIPDSAKNWLSLSGAMIAIVSLFLILFLFIISSIIEARATYLGMIIFILLPGLLIFGLFLIPIGMLITHKKKRTRTKPWPKIDLNSASHRHAVFLFTGGTALFILLTAVGSYQAFRLTESVEFCGQLCHSVMHPEYTAYHQSPHARVACVQCHVGEGADWYVRSKLSGLYQVYSVTFKLYPKPIPTPIHNLRPARETCENCHWPQKFFSRQVLTKYHYLPDEQNTRWRIQLTMKIGAQHPAFGLQKGIHWHINPNIRVEYIARDDKRKDIPWVRMVNLKTNQSIVFTAENDVPSADEIKQAKVRTMDCLDCHNRPSHRYKPPVFFINEAITASEIPQTLPEIKAKAVSICDETKDFSTMDSALQYIDTSLRQYYHENYPNIPKNDSLAVIRAVKGIQKYFSRNIFPDMKANWSAYPNHAGHMEFKGCFRCHDDQHKAPDGKVISRDCNLCHSINMQGTDNHLEKALAGQSLEFKHPEDIGEEWKEMLCSECHTGLTP